MLSQREFCIHDSLQHTFWKSHLVSFEGYKFKFENSRVKRVVDIFEFVISLYSYAENMYA